MSESDSESSRGKVLLGRLATGFENQGAVIRQGSTPSPSVEYYVANRRMAVWVAVGADRRISDAAPIVKKFIGQPFSNLTRWMAKMGDFRAVRLGG